MKSSFYRRKKIGASMIELACGLIFAVPVFLLIFDSVFMAIGVQTNENACREAARTAASGNPASAELQAQSVIEKAAAEKASMIADLRLVSVDNSISAADLKAAQANGGTIAGTVTVTTAVDLKPMFITWITPGRKVWTFQSKQSFPYTYVVPSPVNDE